MKTKKENINQSYLYQGMYLSCLAHGQRKGEKKSDTQKKIKNLL